MLPLRDVLWGGGTRATDRPAVMTVVAPPYACAGTGSLRVVRAIEGADGLRLAAAYEGYDRL